METNIISDVINKTTRASSLSELPPFVNLDADIGKEELKFELSRIEKIINTLTLDEIIDLIKQTKLFRNIVVDKSENPANIVILGLSHEFQQFNAYMDNDNVQIISHIGHTEDNELATFEEMSDFIKYIYKIQLGERFQDDYRKFLFDNYANNSYQQTLEKVSNKNTYIFDDIHEFLKDKTKHDGPVFFIDEVGFVVQEDSKWTIIRDKEKFQPESFDDFIRLVTAYIVAGKHYDQLNESEKSLVENEIHRAPPIYEVQDETNYNPVEIETENDRLREEERVLRKLNNKRAAQVSVVDEFQLDEVDSMYYQQDWSEEEPSVWYGDYDFESLSKEKPANIEDSLDNLFSNLRHRDLSLQDLAFHIPFFRERVEVFNGLYETNLYKFTNNNDEFMLYVYSDFVTAVNGERLPDGLLMSVYNGLGQELDVSSIDKITESLNKMNIKPSHFNNENVDQMTVEEILLTVSQDEKYYPLLNIESFEMKEQNGKTAWQFILNGKTYRIKENKFFCMEDRHQGSSINDLVEYIYGQENSDKINSLFSFLSNNEPVKVEPEIEVIPESELPEIKQDKVEPQSFTDEVLSTENQDVHRDNFNKLVDIRLAEMSDNQYLMDNISLQEFLVLAAKYTAENNKEKSIFKVEKLSDTDFIFAPNTSKSFNISQTDLQETPSQFVKRVAALYNVDAINHIKRIENVLQDYMREKVELQLKKELQENLSRNLDMETPKVQEVEVKKPQDPEIKEKTYEEMFGLDENSIKSPFKQYLYEYQDEHRFSLDWIVSGSLYKTDVEVKQLKSPSDKQEIELHNQWFSITASMGRNSESWVVNRDDKGVFIDKNKDSLITMIDSILSAHNLRFYSDSFHKRIAEDKEKNFLDTYPKDELLRQLGAKATKTTEFAYGDLKIGVGSIANGSQIASIWNRNINGIKSSIRLIQYLLAYDNHIDLLDVNSSNNSEICGFKKAKSILRDMYSGLSSLERSTVFSRSAEKAEKTGYSDFEYSLMLPRPSRTQDLMFDYLRFKRCINPMYVEELSGRYIYQGEYDYYKKGVFNHRYNREDEITTFPVVTFSNQSCASVRGCSDVSNHIKETVPGSKLSNPYYLPPAKDYVSNDDTKIIEIACVEAGVDALSYRSFYPNSNIYAMFGLNTNMLEQALKEYFDNIQANEKQMVRLVYAMDNVHLGDGLDEASRGNYNKLVFKMGKFMYEQFVNGLNDINISDYKNKSMVDLVQEKLLADKTFGGKLLSDEYKEELVRDLADKLTDKIEERLADSTLYDEEIAEFLGLELFNIAYVKTGVFVLKTAEHEKYGQFKDWNEMLEFIVTQKALEKAGHLVEFERTGDIVKDGHVVLDKYYRNNLKELQDIHDEIVFEFNPSLTRKISKPRMKHD